MDDGADLRLARALELVTEAMRLPPRERVPLLRERCAEDPSLLDAALPLLRACEAAASKLGPDNPTVEAGPPVARIHVARFEPGHRVGPYIIRQHLGEGTFGDVYLAESTDVSRQRVALKVIKPGMDSREVLARFEAEQRALGLMNFAGIARVVSGRSPARC